MKHKPFDDVDHNDVLETVKRLVSNHNIAQSQQHISRNSGGRSTQAISSATIDHRLILTPSLRVSAHDRPTKEMPSPHTLQQEPAMTDHTPDDTPENPFAARQSVTPKPAKNEMSPHKETSPPDGTDIDLSELQQKTPFNPLEQQTHLYKDIDSYSPPEHDPNLDEQLGEFLTNEDILADIGLDDEQLRIMIKDVIREELRGEIGERVTRNIRKLVRQEIARTLSSLELGS